MKKNICPNCKKNLKEVGIKFIESGAYIYWVDLDKNKEIDYQLDESIIEDSSYYCGNCDEFLPLNEEDVIKILK